MTLSEWKAQPDVNPHNHPIWDLPGINLFSVNLDCLHIVCLGVAKKALGGAMWALVEPQGPLKARLGRTIEQNIEFLMSLLAAAYKDLDVPHEAHLKS